MNYMYGTMGDQTGAIDDNRLSEIDRVDGTAPKVLPKWETEGSALTILVYSTQ